MRTLFHEPLRHLRSLQRCSRPREGRQRVLTLGNNGSEEETTGIESNDDVDLLVGSVGDGVGEEAVHKVGDEGLESDGVEDCEGRSDMKRCRKVRDR